MKIIIAPDSFKESLSSQDVASEIEAGFRDIFPHAEYLKLPIADGGEGTVVALVAATDGDLINLTVTGPLGDQVQTLLRPQRRQWHRSDRNGPPPAVSTWFRRSAATPC